MNKLASGWLKAGCLPFMALSLFIVSLAESSSNDAFERKITEIALEYKGIPFRLGANPDIDGATDNSHLIYAICMKAAETIGMVFADYMPMKDIITNTHKIKIDQLKNGDLVVLNDGHAALVFNFESPHNYDCIYASKRRKQVVLVNSNEAAFKEYWLKNLKGFYRFDDEMFQPVDQ